jgi:hypothetical protein
MTTKKQWLALTRTDLILEVWEALDCESVGAKELGEIQKAIEDRFGPGAVASPTSIARTLADEGAVLRHPEILEADTNWRQSDGAFATLSNFVIHDFETAEQFIGQLDTLARDFQSRNDRREMAKTRWAAVAAKRQALSIAKSPKFNVRERAQNQEIAGWLTIWIESPEIFGDWLELRKRSTEFQKRFGPDNV